MTDRQTLALYQRKATLLKAIAHPLRVAVIDYLQHGEQCVCDIATQVGSERSNVSRHLSLMARAGILQTRKDGLLVYYSLRTRCAVNFLNCAMQVLQDNVREDVRAVTSPAVRARRAR